MVSGSISARRWMRIRVQRRGTIAVGSQWSVTSQSVISLLQALFVPCHPEKIYNCITFVLNLFFYFCVLNLLQMYLYKIYESYTIDCLRILIIV